MTVLVTRPGKDGEELCQMLQQKGITSQHHPLIQLEKGAGFESLPNNILTHDIIIAVSQYAVYWAKQSLKQYNTHFPEHLEYFAIGKKTAQYLRNITQKNVTFPLISDSEHLLDLPALKLVQNKRILILRGNGGRETIYKTLTERGALVEYNEIYSRKPLPFTDLNIWDNWQQLNVKKLVVTSGEQLNYLISLTPQKYLNWLKQLTLYIPSQRIAQQAIELGFLDIINTGSAANPILLDYLSGTLITGQKDDR